jgi:serine/threonine-protein kinase
VLSRGVVLSDRYQLTERIASGGMGEVWRGTDLLLRREVAVKVLLPSLVSDSEFIARFRTEARMMAALRHPGIVQVYDYGEDAVVDGSRLDYLVMEYIEGAPLSKWIKATGKLGVTETISVVTQAAEALHVAHSAGIVHRDVKPSNLLVRPDGVIVLVDFGVARSTDTTGLTATNMIMGTADYMAPEQAVGQPVSAATDIYALGAVAYCCLAGRPPFTGDNPLQVVTQHLQSEPPTLPTTDIPAPVAALVSRALAKDPADRYPSAAAFAEAARTAQSGPPALATGVTQSGPRAPAAGVTQSGPRASAAGVTQSGPRASAALALQSSPPTPATGLVQGGPPAAAFQNGFSASAVPPRSPGDGPADPPPRYFPPVAPSNGRRNLILAGVAGVVVIGLAGLAALIAFRPAAPQSPELPPQAVGDSVHSPGPGAEVVEPSNADPIPPVRTSKSTRPTARPALPGPTVSAASTTEPTTTTSPKPTATSTKTSASNPYTPGQVCGSGYQVIDSASLSGTSGTVAKVYLLYNSSNANNCTVTLKSTSVGTATAVSAYLEVQGGARNTDSGSFSYYAGPVRAKAAGVCVKWGGSAGGASYNSPFEHCS